MNGTLASSNYCVAILSDHDDLHALAVQKALAAHDDVCCYVIECDRLTERGGLSWSNYESEGFIPTLPTIGGEDVDVRDIDLLWFRRCFMPQLVGDDVNNPVHLELINSTYPLALLGVLLTSFRGKWISDPHATRAAENKLFQLRAARDAGFPTPRTLISNDPETIRRFCSSLNNQIVVKAIRASNQAVLLTQKLRPEHLASDEALRLCPAIYQEYVPGTQHLRVHIFGDYISAILIESEELDWRVNLAVPCRIYHLDESVASKLRKILRSLNLKMGIIDLKLNGAMAIWLEINPQGQFLFAEGLTGLPLTTAMADFLYGEALTAAKNARQK